MGLKTICTNYRSENLVDNTPQPSFKNPGKEILDIINKDFVFIGKARIRGWHAWSAFGLIMGLVIGVGLVIQRGSFEFSSAVGNAYYVATTGDDARSCTTAQDPNFPKRTIASGMSCLSAGSTLFIRGGTYNEGINSNSQTIPTGTSWTSPVIIAAFNGEQVTLSGGINLAASYIQYVIFDGLTLDGAGASFQNGVHHLKIQNGEIKNSPTQGVQGGYGGTTTNNIQIINMKIHHNGTPGEYCNGGSCGGGVYDHGIYIAIQYALIEGCDIYSNTGGGIQIYDSSGGNSSNTIVRNNRIHDNGTVGLILSYGTNLQAYNNLVYANGAGIGANYNASNVQIYNNTVYNHPSGYGIEIGSGASGTIVKNNIIFQNYGPIANYGPGTTTSNNLTTNPNFVSSTDFHLQSNSPAINAGTNLLSVATDYDGAIRPVGSAYDIGAYEYGGTVSSPTPTPTSTSYTCPGGSICDGTPVTGTPNQQVCGTDLRMYTCTSSGWVGTSTSCSCGATPTPISTTDPIVSGPVAWYKFDESSGTTAIDSSGLGNNGTLLGGASRTSGVSGSALSLDGSSGNVTVSDSNSLDLTSAFTISVWVNPTVTYADFKPILVKNYVYYLYAYSTGYCGNGGTFAGYDGGYACNSTLLPANTWTLVTVTSNGSTIRLYKNGAEVSNAPVAGSITASSGTLQIGASQFGEYFNGKLDDVRIYNRALSVSEIQSIYNQATPTPTSTPTSTPTQTPTPTPVSDLTLPTINSWDIQPRTASSPNRNISWNVSDSGGSFLSRVEIQRALFNAVSCNDTNKTGCTWSVQKTVNAPLNVNSWTSSTSISQPKGTYWYGIHVIDGAGNRRNESAPIKVAR
jgi:hypothetical protein